MSFKNVFLDIQPTVIDNEMLYRVIDEQGPRGEAGRLRREEGVSLSEIDTIRLEYMNILRIDHLWMMTSLTKLSLSNNLIEKIENLDKLINLKDLDLSFNYISKIENIDTLVNIEVLTFFNNQITTIENMDTLKKLHVFSIGRNSIEDPDNVLQLRIFKGLRAVNIADNPCAEDPDFRIFIATFLPQITYYEYRRILSTERENGAVMYSQKMREVKENEKARIAAEEREEAEKAEAEFHAESFIEFLSGRQLFDSLFEKDDDAKLLMLVGEEVEEFNKEYEEEFLQTTRQLFEIGQEQFEIRKNEVEQFNCSVSTAREDNQKRSQATMEKFIEEKKEMFAQIRKMQRTFNFEEDGGVISYAENMAFYSDEYNELIHNAWKDLMGLELALFDQIEEANLTFERTLTDLLSGFIEQAQGLFTTCRNLECIYMERVTDAALKLMSSYTAEDVSISEELKFIMEDKEALNNCIGTSHDIHMQLIDAREDRLMTRAKAWLSNLVEGLNKGERKRNRSKVLEINHFLDIQKEEFQELQDEPAGKFVSDLDIMEDID